MNVLSISRSGRAPRFTRWLALFLILAGSQLHAQVIPISGTISENTTLTAGATYHVTGSLNVASGVTLTVPAGTVLKAETAISITINGALIVSGSEGDPVYFTEVRDSTVGELIASGDPFRGTWVGLIITDGGVAEIDHLDLRYASRNTGATSASVLAQAGGLLILRDSILTEGARDGVLIAGGGLAHQIERNLIENHSGDGIELRNTTGAIELVDNLVRDNNGIGLRLTNATGDLVVENNQFIDNGSFGLYVTPQPRSGSLSGNTLTGNSAGPVLLAPNASASVIPLDNTLDGPVYIESGTLTVDSTWNDLHTYFMVGSFTVGAGTSWILPPNVVVKMPALTNLAVNGTLVAAGTEAEPVTITERRDASAGDYSDPGDPFRGAWVGLIITDGGVAEIDHLDLRYAGRVTGQGAITVIDGGLLELRDSTLTEGSRVGVLINSGSLAHQIERNLIENHSGNGIELLNTTGAIVLVDNLVRTNDGQGLRLSNASGDLVVEDNQFIDNGGYGLFVATQPRTGSFSANDLSDNGLGPVWLAANASASVIPVDNTLNGPVHIGSGTLTVDAVWNDLHTYFLTGSFTVGAAASWTLPPNVVVKMPAQTNLSVSGTLMVAGTDSEPVTITDRRDDSVGDYSDPGALGRGSWNGLWVAAGGVAQIDHMDLRHAGRVTGQGAITVIDGGLLELRDSTLTEGSRVGVLINGGSLAHQIERNEIENQSGNGIELLATTGPIEIRDTWLRSLSGHGIRLDNVSGLTLIENNHVQGGSGHGILISNSGLAEDLNGSSPVIEIKRNRIIGQSQDGLRILDSQILLAGNWISENQGAGLTLSGQASNPDIFSNWISGNAGGGIDAVNQANPLIGGTQANGNDIAGNSPFGVRNQTEGLTILARCNWWGHPSGPNQDPENPAGQGDLILGPGSVDASPYLLESAIDGVFRDRFEAVATGREDEC